MVTSVSGVLRTTRRRRALVVALAAIYGMAPQFVQANPGGAVVVHGQATIQTQGNKLTVANTPGAIINWQHFSIGAGETTFFQQQNAASTVLNRVQAHNPALKSQIDGTLGSNGKVFLINPNGVVFGAGSVIDTQGFVASTLSLNDEDFKAGKFRFARDGVAGDIQVQGRISSGNGDVYLIAPNVGTDGNAVIRSEGGNVVLAAGEMVEITGRNLNDITFEVQNRSNAVVNLGRLEGGAVGVFAGTLRHSGIVQAQTLILDGGRLVLKAQGDVTLGAGSRSIASGINQGGMVQVASQQGNIQLQAGAQVSAEATAGADPIQATPRGGTVDVQASSGYVSIDAGAAIDASGGRGGAVEVRAHRMVQSGVVRADGRDTLGGSVTVQIASRLIQDQSAQVSARGAMRGGTVELLVDTDANGDGNLYSSARIDASAAGGIGGSVTLTGRDISLTAAQVSVDGDAGGGNIRIGGGRAGRDASVANAQNLFANGAVQLHAGARIDGDGGSIVTWADGVNRFAGSLQARGGPVGGNGGFIEVSGKAETQFDGLANAGASFGSAGTFLLDPKFILIQSSAVIPGVSVELVDPNPGNNNFFGQTLQLLGGNILVSNPNDDFAGNNSGAVYQFDGTTGALLSSLRGSSAGDQVGSGGLLSVSGGNAVIRSPLWSASAGALTWTNGVAPLGGALGPTNSLVGASAGDGLGSGGFQNLFNGKYVVFTPNWSNGKGAVTWFDAVGGTTTGAVNSANSLVGSADGDAVGSGGLVNFFTGKGVIRSPNWNGSAGAFTYISNLALGATGTINASPGTGNSLVGAAPGDRLGNGGFFALGSGNYAVVSPDASVNGTASGAVTWYDTANGVVGPLGAANSLLGNSANDAVGSDGIETVANAGNYLIRSPMWNGTRGALTFASGNAPITGTPDLLTSLAGNSLLGSNPGDAIGDRSVEHLFYSGGGNFVVVHPNWNNAGAANAGAATWGSGSTGFGTTAVVSAGNSIVGSSAGDAIGSGGIIQLYSGNFLVRSPTWGGGAGAVSFALGNSLTAGTVSASDTFSIVGAATGDNLGSGGTTVFYNNSGNFVVSSPNWSNGAATLAGAVTWGSQLTGFAIPGLITSANSLVGSNMGDRIGSSGITESFASGNYMVASPQWSGGRGAVSFGRGGSAISGVVGASDGLSIVGGATTDDVGGLGVRVLDNGHFLVLNPDWSNGGGTLNVGAVTWGDAATGFVSPGLLGNTNSLVGTNANDRVGSGGHRMVGFSGNYLIRSPQWDGARGALTFAVGNAPITGSPDNVTSTNSNSLLGVFANELIGGGTIQTLFNSGNFVVRHVNWANTPSVPNAGAVTWGSGVTGFGATAVVSSANSLLGSASGDRVGSDGNTELSSGNFLVHSPSWGGGAGAVSFASGTSVTAGVVSASDGVSLVGGDPGDAVGSGGTMQLSSGNFLVRSPNWKYVNAAQAGAVTWGNGLTGFASPGLVSAANSVFGSSPNDRVGNIVSTLNNGNFVLVNPNWDNGAATDAGAVTWGDGTTGFIALGALSSANSLVGTQSNDQVGSSGVQQLFNSGFISSGKYLVRSPLWSNGGATQAGAVTWFDQNTGITGEVNAGTSLVGTSAGDLVGNGSMVYSTADGQVMRNASWGAGRGALTFIPISVPLPVGAVGAGNSLVGATAGDTVGSGGVSLIDGGIAALRSPNWSNGAATSAGAVTWVNTALPSAGFIGTVTPGNSLVGSSVNDQVGSGGISTISGAPLYAVRSQSWDNGGLADVGAITWASSANLPIGPVTASNSLIGSTANDRVGLSSSFSANNAFGYLLVSNTTWNGSRGAVTWMNRATPLTGEITSANSLVGANPSDLVGNGGSSFLGSGAYYVLSPSFGASAGAVSVGTAAGGIAGVVSAANSLVGQNPGDGYGLFTTLSNDRLLVRAANADSGGLNNNGRVHIYAGGAGGGSGPGGVLGAQAFSDNAGSSVTITPQQIRAILNTGTHVQLQANSDITLAALSDIFVNNPSGDGGDFTLQAGRSVYLLSSIGTDNGDLTIIGNELASYGVLTAHRDPGIAEIVMANGTRLDSGAGTVTLHLRDGAGRAGMQAAASDILIRSVSAGTLVAKNDTGGVVIGALAATAPSEVFVLGNASIIAKTSVSLLGGVAGAQAVLSADGQIKIESPNPITDPAPILTLTNGGSLARIVNPPGTFPLILSGSQCIGCTVVSEFEITGANNSILDTITSALLALQLNLGGDLPSQLDPDEDDDIGIESGETCQ